MEQKKGICNFLKRFGENNLEEKLNDVFEKISKWFDSNKKMAFLIAFFAGILTHITIITNTIMGQDGLWNSMEYSRPGDFEITLGRWGIEIMQRFNYFIAIPTISTISCIFIIAITAIFIVDLFELKNKLSIVIVSLMIVVFPTLTVTLLYLYTAFAYCSNMLIATLVIWFIYKFKYSKAGILISSVLVMLSLSIYQSYIGVSLGLCLMLTILYLIKAEKSIKDIFILVLKTIIVFIIGGIFYYIATNLLLKIKGLSFSSYKSMNDFGVKSVLFGLTTTIPNCYKDFIKFFIKDSIIFNTNYKRHIFNGVFIVITGVFSILSAIQIKTENKKEKNIRRVLAIIFVLLIPIALNFIDVLVKENVMYALTAYQMILLIPMGISLMENVNKFIITKLLLIMSCFYIILTYYIADNASYADMQMRFNQAQAVTIRMMDRIETTEGYKKNMPICIIGIIGDNNYPKVGNLYDFSVGSVFMNPVFHGSYEGSIGTMEKYAKVFLGQTLTFCDAETYEKIVRSDEVKGLNDFPENNCTKIIDGVMVIKLSNYIPLPNGTLLYDEY